MKSKNLMLLIIGVLIYLLYTQKSNVQTQTRTATRTSGERAELPLWSRIMSNGKYRKVKNVS